MTQKHIKAVTIVHNNLWSYVVCPLKNQVKYPKHNVTIPLTYPRDPHTLCTIFHQISGILIKFLIGFHWIVNTPAKHAKIININDTNPEIKNN